MSEIAQHQPPGILLTIADIRRWEVELRRFDDEIATIMAKREHVQKMLDAASLFVDRSDISELPDEPVKIGDDSVLEQVEEAIDAVSLPSEVTKEGTWAHVIYGIVSAAEMGMTYAEVRQAALASALGPKLRSSDKGYHNAISRLARGEVLIRQYGRLFTHEAFERFQKAADAGEVSTVVPQPFVHSPMGEAILKIVHKHPGLIGKEIIAELRKDVEFNATLTPHETGAYNIIARLVKRRQIVRRDDGGCVPGPDFPKELVGQLPDGDGALNGNAASAPFAREAATSLFESRSGFNS